MKEKIDIWWLVNPVAFTYFLQKETNTVSLFYFQTKLGNEKKEMRNANGENRHLLN